MRSSRYKACWKFAEQKNYKNNPLSLTIEVVKENRTKKTGHTGTLALGFSSDMPTCIFEDSLNNTCNPK